MWMPNTPSLPHSPKSLVLTIVQCTLLEERAKRDAKRIQSLELLSKQDPKLKNGSEEKYLKDMDDLSSKIYKLEERNQTLIEEIKALKTELRDRKKDFEHNVNDMQKQHDRNTRTLTQKHKEYSGTPPMLISHVLRNNWYSLVPRRVQERLQKRSRRVASQTCNTRIRFTQKISKAHARSKIRGFRTRGKQLLSSVTGLGSNLLSLFP